MDWFGARVNEGKQGAIDLRLVIHFCLARTSHTTNFNRTFGGH